MEFFTILLCFVACFACISTTKQKPDVLFTDAIQNILMEIIDSMKDNKTNQISEAELLNLNKEYFFNDSTIPTLLKQDKSENKEDVDYINFIRQKFEIIRRIELAVTQYTENCEHTEFISKADAIRIMENLCGEMVLYFKLEDIINHGISQSWSTDGKPRPKVYKITQYKEALKNKGTDEGEISIKALKEISEDYFNSNTKLLEIIDENNDDDTRMVNIENVFNALSSKLEYVENILKQNKLKCDDMGFIGKNDAIQIIDSSPIENIHIETLKTMLINSKTANETNTESSTVN